MDDLALLDQWREGDREAGDALFDRHFESVYRFFRNKINGDAADLVQRTFLACVEGRDRFEKRSSFRTFLFSVARHELYAHYRKEKRQENVDFGVTSLADISPTPTSMIAEKHDHRLLLEALRAIPVDLQVAVELHYWEGLTGPQLAEVLDIPEPTVRSRLHRARESLAKKIEALAARPGRLESTMTSLDSFMRSVRPEGV